MRNFLNNFVRRLISIVLTQELGNSIYASLFKFKNKHIRFTRLIYGTANDEEIFNNILREHDGKYEIWMIHSSFNDMIPMYIGKLSNLLSMMISYCTQNNITLTMPAFFGGSILENKEYYENGKHIFDVNKTESGVGLITELFRRTPNVKRSIHPTHSVCALGPLADKLTGNHHLADTTFGEGTPFVEMTKYKTMILGLGTDAFGAGTQVHSAEDILKNDYPISLHSDIIPVKCLDKSGNIVLYNLRIRDRKYVYDEKTIYKILGNISKKWTYKGIPFFQTQADVVTETLIEAARAGETIYKEIKY